MDNNQLYPLIVYIAPAIFAITCILILLLHIKKEREHIDKQPVRILISYYAFAAFAWVSVTFYIYAPHIFIYMSSLCYLSFLLVQVIFFHFVVTITQVKKSYKFSYIHYIIPILIFIILTVWSLFIPHEIQMQVITNRGIPVDGYEAYSRFSTSRLLVRLLYSFIYTVLSLYYLIRYRKIIKNYSADEERGSLKWLYIFIFVAFVLLSGPILSVTISRSSIIFSLSVLLPVILLLFQHSTLCYNVIIKNYILIYKDIPGDAEEKKETNRNHYTETYLNKDDFEKYLEENKPYLNPNLKITDLTIPLHTNRSYLSFFINKNYNKNFCQFINDLRLEEFNKIRSYPQNEGINEMELVMKVGFGSYRSFLRTKKNKSVQQQKISLTD